MSLSRRIRHILSGGSDGWEVFYRAREMRKAGIAVTELTIGEHDIRTAAPILQHMHAQAMGGHTGYAAVPGTDALRETVARRMTARTGVATGPANVLITPGCQAGLFAGHMALCDPGDAALYIDPCYITYPGTIRSAGVVPIAVQTRPEDAFQPRASDIAAHAPSARSLLINSPNNPTGIVYRRDTLEGIAEVCLAHDLWLISDEVYDSQVWEGNHFSPRALPGMAERTLVVGSMSKSHAMTGSRCGWIVGPELAIEALTNLATNTNYGVPGYIQDASVFALHQGAEFEAEVAAPFRRRRAIAHQILSGQTALSLVPAQGAMYLMLDVRATGLSGEGFANGLLEEHHVAVMPGESFGMAAAGHIRVAMTIADDDFANALSIVCKYAETLVYYRLREERVCESIVSKARFRAGAAAGGDEQSRGRVGARAHAPPPLRPSSLPYYMAFPQNLEPARPAGAGQNQEPRR